MPQVIAPVAAAISAWAATTTTIVGVAVTYGTLAKIAILGAAMAYSAAQNRKLRNSLNRTKEDQGRDVMTRDPLASRRYIYGQVLTTGTIVYMATEGTKNENLHIVVALAAREITEIGQLYLDNMEAVTIDGSGFATGKYAGYMSVEKYLGTTTQSASGALIAAFPGVWTSAHKLSGIAYVHINIKHSPDLYPNGVPTFKFLCKGHRVFDPRDGGQSSATPSTWTYSNNSALCLADWLNDGDLGCGIAWSRIKQTDLIEAANECDESVVTDSGTEKRYTTNGLVMSDSTRDSVITDLSSAMAGAAVDTGGLWTIRAGSYRTPTVDLTDDDLCGAIHVQTRQSRRDTFNGVKGVYISPDNQWAAADFPPIKNDTYKGWDGGIRLWKDVSYPFTTSSPTAQRLAKIDLERGRQQIIVSGTYKLKAFKCMPLDTVRITRASLGWVNKEFEVKSWSFAVVDDQNGGLVVAVNLTLQETASAVWDWANGEETTVDLAPNTTLPDPSVVPDVTGLTLLTDATTVYLQPDGTVSPRIKVTWNLPNNIFIENGGWVQLEYRQNGVGNYIPWNRVRGDVQEEYITDVKVGIQFQVRAKFENQIGVRSTNWVVVVSAAVVGDTTTPATPGSLVGEAVPGYNRLKWDPSTSNTVNEYAIYRSVVSGIAGFALLANTALTQFDDSGITRGTSYWYKVKAVSASEVASLDSNVVGPLVALDPAVGAVIPADPATAPARSSGVYNTGYGNYVADDGTALAWENLIFTGGNADTDLVNVLYRKTGSADWNIAGQFKATGAAITARFDDLSPGVAYQWTTVFISAAGASAIGPIQAYTAALKTEGGTAAITVPSGGTINAPGSAFPGIPAYQGTILMYGTIIGFTAPADKDIDYVEVKAVSTNVDTSIVYTWYPIDGETAKVKMAPNVTGCAYLYNVLGTPGGYVFMRSVDHSGGTSAWVALGAIGTDFGYAGEPVVESMVFNVDNFGADGDGIADDSVPAADCYAAAVANGAQSIYFTPGKTYKLPGVIEILDDNITIVAYGAILIGADDADPTRFRWNGVSRGGLKGGFFDGQYSSAAKNLTAGMVEIQDSDYINIQDADFSNHAKAGIKIIGNSKYGSVCWNTFYADFCAIDSDDDTTNQPIGFKVIGNVVRAGLGATDENFSGGFKFSGIDGVDSSAGHTITHNQMYSPGQVAIEIQSGINDSVISHNYFTGPGFGISVSYCYRVTVEGNTGDMIRSGTDQGWGLEAANSYEVAFAGNTIRMDGDIGLGVSIDTSYGCSVIGGSIGKAGISINIQLSEDTLISGVVLNASGTHIVYNKDSSGTTVTGCLMKSDAGLFSALFIDATDSSCESIKFSNNTLIGAFTNCFIKLYAPNSSYGIRDLIVVDNNVKRASTTEAISLGTVAAPITQLQRIRVYDNTGSGSVTDFGGEFNLEYVNVGATDVSYFWGYYTYEKGTIAFDCTGANRTFELPPAAGLQGYEVAAARINSGGESDYKLTLIPATGDTIKGNPVLRTDHEHVRVRSDGTDWHVTSRTHGFLSIGTDEPEGILDLNRAVASGKNWAYLNGAVGTNNPSAARTIGLMVGVSLSAGVFRTKVLYGTGAGSNPIMQIGRWSGSAETIDWTHDAGDISGAGHINADGGFYVSSNKVVGAREAAVADASTGAPTDAPIDASGGGSMTGADTVSKAALESTLAALAGKINAVADKANTTAGVANDAGSKTNLLKSKMHNHGLIA